MKIFIGGSKGIKVPKHMLEASLSRMMAANAEILIGDCYGTDAAVQKILAEKGYSKVGVYAVTGTARHNVGSWRVVPVLEETDAVSFSQYRRRDSAMAQAADSGYMLWDEKSKGTFVNIVELIGLGKPVEVYLAKAQKTVLLQSFEELADLLPEKSGVFLTAEEQRDLLNRFMPSESMRRYLSTKPLSKQRLSAIICGSPVPLSDKQSWMRRLATKENLFTDIVYDCAELTDKESAGLYAESQIENAFAYRAGQIGRALRELSPNPGEIFILIEAWYDEELKDRKSGSGTPFLSAEKVMEYIRYDMQESEVDEGSTCWYELQKWVPDGADGLRHTYTFYFWLDKVIYFEKMEKALHTPYLFLPKSKEYAGESQHLNLPIPFRAGDIVKIDCRPFEPVRHAVILEVGDNADCCSVQALCGTDTDMWILGALKHGHLFQHDFCMLSPLYQLTECGGALSEHEDLLYRIKAYIDGDETKGRALWNRLSELRELNRALILSILHDGLEAGETIPCKT